VRFLSDVQRARPCWRSHAVFQASSTRSRGVPCVHLTVEHLQRHSCSTLTDAVLSLAPHNVRSLVRFRRWILDRRRFRFVCGSFGRFFWRLLRPRALIVVRHLIHLSPRTLLLLPTSGIKGCATKTTAEWFQTTPKSLIFAEIPNEASRFCQGVE
jgi:hypothetical protein